MQWRKSSYSGGTGNGNCVEVAWRKSTFSGGTGNGDCVEVAWQKSTFSNGTGNGDCVEVAYLPTRIAVRDSKNTTGPHLTLPPPAWTALLTLSRTTP